MFCPNCGKQIPDESTKCPNCQMANIVINTQSGVVKGFFLLLLSFFTMPINTLKITAILLKEIGNEGKFDIRATEIPHLTWLSIAGRFLASIIVVSIFTIGVLKGLMSLRHLHQSVGDAIGGLLVSIIGGVFFAIIANWVIMISLELLLLWVGIANDIKRIGSKD